MRAVIPRRESHTRKRFFFNKLKRFISKKDFHFSAIAEATFDELVRQWVTKVLLDGSTHWPCAMLRLISFVNEEVFYFFGNFEFYALILQPRVHFLKLDSDNLVQGVLFPTNEKPKTSSMRLRNSGLKDLRNSSRTSFRFRFRVSSWRSC